MELIYEILHHFDSYTFAKIVSILVVVVGFTSWIVFLPQIKLLLKLREATSISLGLVWGSSIMQLIMIVHAIIGKDWPLVFALSTSLMCLLIIVVLIYYYRKFPGGR